MSDYRVEFPDDQAWNIKVKTKKGQKKDEVLRDAHARASAARAAEGKIEPIPFEACTVRKMTPELRAELKGVAYLPPAEMLRRCLSIVYSYKERNLSLTVRGMYYQLVSRGLLPSGQAEYNRVKNGLAKARLRGDFPLGLLSDSSRTLHKGQATRYDLDVPHALSQAKSWIPQLDRFFLQAARWYRQPNLPIVLFEKEALANAFKPICEELEVSWMAVKGYSSMSAIFELHKLMKDSVDPEIRDRGDLETLGLDGMQDLDPTKSGTVGKKHMEMLLEGHGVAVDDLEFEIEDGDSGQGFWAEQTEEDGSLREHWYGERKNWRYGLLTADQWHQGTAQTIRILYFGDHDPDGMEIPNDLERRLKVIQVRDDQIIPFTIERCGLNRDQIENFNPPPFWAKASSTRHPIYMQNHPWTRNRAWELDALDPDVLQSITREAVDGYFDIDIHTTVLEALAGMREQFNQQMQATVLPGLIREEDDD